MLERQRRMSRAISDGCSPTTNFEPFVSVITVSGLPSTIWIWSGFRYSGASGWVRRWTTIIVSPSGAPGAASYAEAAPDPGSLVLEVDELLEHVVGGRDHARVGLEAALRGDHPRELLREVDVRHLDRRAGEHAGAARAARGVDGLGARVRRD